VNYGILPGADRNAIAISDMNPNHINLNYEEMLMKKTKMIAALGTAILVLSLAAPTRAELIRLYPEDFGAFRPEIITVLNPFIEQLSGLTVPISEEVLLDDFFCEWLVVTMEANIVFDITDSYFSLYWDTVGENDLVFQGVFDQWTFLGDFDLVGEDCIGFIDFEMELLEGDIGAAVTVAEMVLIPYWNTETASLELHHKQYGSELMYSVTFYDFFLDLGLIWPLDEILEPLIQAEIQMDLQEIMRHTLLGPDGLVFGVVQGAMIWLYALHQAFGCTVYYDSAMPIEAIGLDQALADLGVCLLPALLIFGLKRRGRR